MPANPIRVRDIFLAALDRPAEDRSSYVSAACLGDAELQAEVERLLDADAAPDSILELASPTVAEATGDFSNALGSRDRSESRDPPTEVAGACIAGKYKLLQQIGEGGMGTVWLANQIAPVKRRVAVKLIRVDRGQTRTILGRFEAERQAIALMDHPHIAKLLDAGTTEAGAPFFVMELVKGIPLTDYCDQHRLGIPERLALFMRICSAVQHAHQKGIIHRDLKPSNILVESHDGKPAPKVIDFGLAKATTGLELTENTVLSGFGTVLGTPLYMAPEQAAFNAIDIDTRADVYALGVILYELLTGTTPITREAIRQARHDEMLRLIREQEAPTPSSRLSETDARPTIAANRSTEPDRLGRFVKGELDWIVMKALAKERERRYETANGFARDIERFLNHEPVTAGPPTAGYRLRKFVRRNRGPVIAAGLVLLTLLAGIAGTTAGFYRAEQRRNEAENARAAETIQRRTAEENERKALAAAEKERMAREAEARERKFAEAIAAFVKDDFLALTSVEGQVRFGGPNRNQLTKDTTLRELLDRAAEKLKARKNLDPRIEAELCWIVGVNYRGAGDSAKGVPFLERALELRKQAFGLDHAETIVAMNSLGIAYGIAGRLEQALPLLEDTLSRMKVTFGPEHPTTLTCMGNLAAGYLAAEKLDLALPLLEKRLETTKARLGPEHASTLTSMGQLARGYRDIGKPQLALPLFEQALQGMRASLGPDHPITLIGMIDLGGAYKSAGKLDLALPLFEQTLQRAKSRLGPDHPTTLASMNNLAGAYRAAGKLDLALPLFQEALRGMMAKLGPDHPDTLNSMGGLALVYQSARKLDLALPLFEESLQRTKARLGPDHSDSLTCMKNLALCHRDTGKFELALPLLEETLDRTKTKFGPAHPRTLQTMSDLAETYQAAGKLDLALPLLEDTLNHSRAELGPDHPNTLNSMNSLALGYMAARKSNQALPLLEQALNGTKAKLGPDHPNTLTCMHNLARGYLDAGKSDLALPLLEETLKLRRARIGPSHPDTLNSMNDLAGGYWSANRLDRSVPLLEELLPIHQRTLGRQHPTTQGTVANLGVNYKDAGRLAEALPLLEEAHRSSSRIPTLRWVGRQLLEGYVKAGKRAEVTTLVRENLAEARRALAKDTPPMAGALAQNGLALLRVGAFDEAEPLLLEALAILEKSQPDAWTTFNTRSMLGGALLGRKKYAEAEPLLVQGHEGMKAREATIPPRGRACIPEALDRLIELYTATAKPDEAERWKAERARYPEAAASPSREGK